MPHSGACAPRLLDRGEQGVADIGDRDDDGEHRRGQAHPPGAPALQHDRLSLRGERAELGEQVPGIAFHEGAQLRRAGDPAGGGEGLGELGLGEIVQRLPVHPRGVGADRQDQHHVAQVDGLPPGRGADLGEGHVDQQQLPAADHQVAGLDVAVGDPRVPQRADQPQSLADHLVVDVGVADFRGAVEELGDQQVLPLGGDLHDAVGPGNGDPGVLQQAQGVVLVLGQAPHGLEGVLVLQGAVQDRPPYLVPAVGADVALGVELGEQVLLRGALGPQPQRGGPGGGLQPDRRDAGDGEPELVAHALPDRLAARAGHVHVRGVAAPVGDREHLVRGEETERADRDRDAERHPQEQVVHVIDGQVQAGQAEHGHHDRDGRLRAGAGPPGNDQAVGDAYQEGGEDPRRERRRGVPCPARDDRHTVGARPRELLG